MNLNEIFKNIPGDVGIFLNRSDNDKNKGKWICSMHAHENSPFDYQSKYYDIAEEAAKELANNYEKLLPKILEGHFISDVFNGHEINLYYDDINHLWKATLYGYYTQPNLELAACGKTKEESIKNLFMIYSNENK